MITVNYQPLWSGPRGQPKHQVDIGMGGVPVIRVEDADHNHSRVLLLVHAHDGRDLHLEYAERTLAYVHRLWGRDVVLETLVNGKRTHLTYGERGFSARPVK